jgi:homoserine/homoserine lactone efflux protein
MNLQTWLLFFLAYSLVTYSPGPNVLAVVTHAVRYGYRSIAVTITANLFCQLIIVTVVGLGAGALLTTDSFFYKLMKWAGAAYLFYLGVNMIWKIASKSAAPFELDARARETVVVPSTYQRFREAFLVSASNPKTVIFLSAFLPQFLEPDRPLFPQFALMFLTIAGIVASVHSVYAYIAVSLQRRIVGNHASKAVSLLSGGVFIALALLLVLSPG